ncbi:GIY-YIG nuclease family protein [Pseudoxanthomonas mexicana]|uniref:GIY-YIG nuclease family protein n=1 Tax=Pseudoxanthomonas mexicana TaxID=128785 RepID=UPI00398B77F0
MKSPSCYLYVLPLAYEDILKIGISHDPLARAQAFSRRYYEFFDLPRSLLVEFDGRREAQARETQLHRRLCELNAMQPLTVPARAAGGTEWYRGAYETVRGEIERDLAAGHRGHAGGIDWWRGRLQDQREALFEWATQAFRDDVPGALPVAGRHALLADALDAYACLDVALEGALPAEVEAWYRRHRQAG